MSRSILIPAIILMLVSFPVLQGQQDSVIHSASFDLLKGRDGDPVGRYTIGSSMNREGDRLFLEETATLHVDGKDLYFYGRAIYAVGQFYTPLSASCVTMRNGDTMLVGWVSLRPDSIDMGADVYFDRYMRQTGASIPKTKSIARPAGPLVFSTALPFILPLFRSSDSIITVLEFPDDDDELLHVATYRWMRSGGGDTIQVGSTDSRGYPTMFTYGLDGGLTGVILWGKFIGVEVRAKE